MRWLSGSSAAAAAFLLASAPQAAQAQSLLSAPDFHARDVRISAPAELGVENIQISAPITLSDAYQPQAPAGMVAINQAQDVADRISLTQAFQANATFASEPTAFARAANADVITLSNAATFINWTPLDTANSDDLINILPTGTSLTFVGPDSGYTVLNRIVPTGITTSGDLRGIAFGGNVASRLGAVDGAFGGNIWFYSPGGIVVGAGAVFDVGGLVLTTNDIDTTGGLFGVGGEIRFSGAADSVSSVVIENGATINALNDRSSYVAIVAPRVVQGGTVNVDGSAAYVAAEQADLTINNGLFDIAIGVGTTDANGVVHTGSTLGPASTPTIDGFGNVTDADAQAIYMVAVPKNDAVTMLVGGSLGYQPAASAAIINGHVVLSAGANVSTTGNQTNAGFAFDKAAADSDSNIQLQNVAFGSSVSTFATNGIVAATASVTDFIETDNSVGTQDLLLEARNQIDINAFGDGTISANGNIILRAGTDGVGGTININADQGGLTAIGDLVVDASAAGLDDFDTILNNGGTGIGQDAVGGEININISGGGDLVVGGIARFVASAQGGKGEDQNGSGQGGNINLNIASGTFNVTGTTFFDTQVLAAQSSKDGGNGPGLIGSDSIGGNINLDLSGGAVTTGNIVVNLGAIASVGGASDVAQSNDATSGAFDLTVTGGSHVINGLDIDAVADAGTGSFDATGKGISGFARSGGANLLIDSGSLTVNSDINSNFSTYGISPASSASEVALTVQNSGTLAVDGDFNVNTLAFNGIDAVTSTAGSISILTDNGTITMGGIFLDSSARLSDFFSSFSIDERRDFQAGNISLVAQNGGTFTSGSSRFSANGSSGNTNAGHGTGGDIFIHANDGSINFTDFVAIDSSGVGGVGGNSDNPASLGIGQGGAINLRVEGTGGVLSFADLDVRSNGSIEGDVELGTPSFEGDGGVGFGGTVTFDLLGGTFTADDVSVGSDGSGGGGGDIVTLPDSSAASQVTPADLTVVDAPFAGGVSAGDGGDGQGGDVTINLNGGNATVANLNITANGFGGDGADGDINNGTAGGAGGRGIGGNATFNAQSGSLTVTSTLTVSAEGNNQLLAYYGSSGAGGFGYGSDGGAGGAGIGGTATFNLDGSATIDADQVVISTSAEGGYGGSTTFAYGASSDRIQAGVGGNGGDATGGDAIFNNSAGTLNFSQLLVTSTGTGGDGGFVFGFTGEADNVAGDGGDGRGGNAAININQDDLNNPVYVVDASGVGGNGGNGLDGGNGGAAFGGIAAININDATADPDDPTIIANATGGAGGLGAVDPATGNAGNSGNGGDAFGGTARLQVTGAGGNIDLGFIIQESNAVGGAGGDGYGYFSGNGGDGGDGGDATGGRSELVTRTGGTINVTSGPFDFTSTGTGGAGGSGGYTYDSTPGDGGDGGTGTGGTSMMLAQGGTITGQDVNFTVAGIGGAGGAGGINDLGIGADGLTGTGGTGSGGTATIEVQEGSPGIITLGNVVASANGTSGSGGFPFAGFGGRIEVTDSSTDPAGLITLGTLTVEAFDTDSGSIAFSNTTPLGGFYVTGNSGAMTIAGDLTVNVVGNIEYSLVGDGQMTVGGNALLNTSQDILIDHSNNLTPVNSIDVVGTFTATAQGNFISTDGSRINAGGSATVRAEQNATVADIAGVGLVDISALQNVTVNNAAVTGTPVTIVLGALSVVGAPQLTINAGYDPTATPTPTFDPNYNATITGEVTSTGLIAIGAGGSAFFRTGSNTVSDNSLAVRTGDDIVIESGASLTAANNPSTTPNPAFTFSNPGNLILQAGDFTDLFGSPIGTLTSPILTPISSIVAAGDLNANNFAVVMTANAVDGLGGTISASSISVDINDAPANGVTQRDDNGLLSAQCVEGNACLGTLIADDLIYIGQASNNDVIQAFVESGTVSANDILVTTRRDIIMGTDGIATVLDATNQLALQSNEGNIDLADVSATSNTITINAAGSLLGTAALTSVNDIGITVGADINAASIDTGRQLTTVALVGGGFEASYSVPGNITVGTLTQGGGVNVNIIAGGDISFGQINLPSNRSITLTAATGDTFLGSNSSATSISILGNNVGFNDLLSSGNITLNATTGDLTGTGPGDLTAGGLIDLEAASGSVTAGTINAGSDIDIVGSGDVVVEAMLGGFTDILTTGAVDIGSADTLRLEAQGSSISLGTANIISNAFAASGALVLTATTGAIDIGDATTARATTLDAAADINIGNLASGGAVTADAGGDIAFTAAAGDSVQFNAGGNIAGGDVDASVNTLFSNVAVLNAGGSVTAGTINAVDGIDIDSGGDVIVEAMLGGFTEILTTGAVDIGSADTLRLEAQGSSISLGTANIISNAFAASGALVLTATTGAIDIGDATTARATTLDAATSISIGTLAATGAFGAAAGANVALGTTSGERIIVTSGGDITGISAMTSTGGNVVTLTADGAINVNIIDAANNVNLDSGGTITTNSIQGAFIDALAVGAVTIGSAAGTRLDVTGDGIAIVTANITNNAFAASGEINLDAGSGAATIGTANSDKNTTIVGGSVRLDQGNIVGDLVLNATAGDIDGTGTVTVGGAIDLDASGNIGFGDLTAQGGTFTVDAGGNINFSNASSSSDLAINGATIEFDTASAADIVINAVNDVLINSSANAANDLQITAGGLIDIQGNVVGGSITTVSSDMNIGSTGNLGQTDLTGDIQIFTDGTTQMVLGGANNPTGVFYLGNDEFSRIHSGGDLTLTTVPTGIGGFDLTVQDLNVLVADNVSGPQSANIGLSNTLNLVSGQSIAVVGFVDFSNANANSGINFTAGQDLFIDAASGVIQMTDVNGNFSGSGSLSISAPNVYAMTTQALADIAGLSAADIDLRLANNDGIDLPDGLIRADNVQIAVIDNLLIQNTANGTDFADRRGFNVGSLSIAGPSTGNANIVINGIVGGATGLDTIPATDVAIGFDPASTINGCVINNPAGCTPTPTPTPTPAPTPTPTPTPVPTEPEFGEPVQDVIEEEVTPEQYASDPFETYLIEIKENEEYAEDPLIDEPVTGAGNDDLWVDETECERGDDGECPVDEETEALEPVE